MKSKPTVNVGRPRNAPGKGLVRVAGMVSPALRDALRAFANRHGCESESQALRMALALGVGR